MRTKEAAVVVTVTVTSEGLTPSRVTEAGETEHVDSDGPPLQVKTTGPTKPPAGVTFSLYVAVAPAETVALVALSAEGRALLQYGAFRRGPVISSPACPSICEEEVHYTTFDCDVADFSLNWPVRKPFRTEQGLEPDCFAGCTSKFEPDIRNRSSSNPSQRANRSL